MLHWRCPRAGHGRTKFERNFTSAINVTLFKTSKKADSVPRDIDVLQTQVKKHPLQNNVEEDSSQKFHYEKLPPKIAQAHPTGKI